MDNDQPKFSLLGVVVKYKNYTLVEYLLTNEGLNVRLDAAVTDYC